MEIKVQNNSLVVTTAIKASEFSEAAAYVPQALSVYDDKGAQVYRVNSGSFALKTFGATFNAVIDGKMALTYPLPMGIQENDAKELIKTQWALELAALAKHEPVLITQITEQLRPIRATMNEIKFEG